MRWGKFRGEPFALEGEAGRFLSGNNFFPHRPTRQIYFFFSRENSAKIMGGGDYLVQGLFFSLQSRVGRPSNENLRKTKK